MAAGMQTSGYKAVIIQNPDDARIAMVAALDAIAFPDKSLSQGEFRDFIHKGGVLFCYEDMSTGNIVSNYTLSTSPDASATSRFERQLPHGIGYRDGAAVHPAHRGKGLMAQLLVHVERYAKANGLMGLSSSIYSWNLPSLKTAMANGAIVLGRAAQFYDDQPQSSMLILGHDFMVGNPWEDIQREALQDRIAAEGRATISLQSQYGVVNTALDEAIAQLLTEGYVGVSCQRIDEQRGALLFVKRVDGFPAESNERLVALARRIKQAIET